LNRYRAHQRRLACGGRLPIDSQSRHAFGFDSPISFVPFQVDPASKLSSTFVDLAIASHPRRELARELAATFTVGWLYDFGLVCISESAVIGLALFAFPKRVIELW